ncbi:hypothetical protein [Nocardioides sp. zg-1230]|uniref:hypothetical protein n=1 Tax=Nocardioides sp. zg-1230 TaxID=2736601 RepID=UPI00155171C6|nr:hypothetical protein [Nocardioides sp. zg-1230]NPC44372.1 hypothetical protein [Nocardioides sp. zg-1230]
MRLVMSRDLTELVERGGGLGAGTQRVEPFRPPHQIAADPVQDADGLRAQRCLDLHQQRLVGPRGASCGNEELQRLRHRRKNWLAGFLTQSDGLGATCFGRRPGSGGDVGQRESGLGVQHHHHRAGVPGSRQQPAVVLGGGSVVAHVQRGDAQVGQQVLVISVEDLGGGEQPLHDRCGVVPSVVHDVVEPDQQVGECLLASGGPGAGWVGEVERPDVDAGVPTERGDRGSEHRHLPGPGRVMASDLCGGLQDHPVAELDGPGVPLHPRAKPRDVGT